MPLPAPDRPSQPHEGSAPSPWVAHFLEGVPKGGRVLDIACGRGRHIRLALARGHPVTGIDRDISRLGDLAARPDVEIIQADLETAGPCPLASRTYPGVIVTNYLWRPLLPAICASVGPAGVLIYETFALGHAQLGGRPSNADFLLHPNELAKAALGAGLVLIAFEQIREPVPHPRIIQRLAAVGPAHEWAISPPLRLQT